MRIQAKLCTTSSCCFMKSGVPLCCSPVCEGFPLLPSPTPPPPPPTLPLPNPAPGGPGHWWIVWLVGSWAAMSRARSKAPPCIFFLRGACNRGDTCQYPHVAPSVEVCPPLESCTIPTSYKGLEVLTKESENGEHSGRLRRES